jgi:hypothetical protein
MAGIWLLTPGLSLVDEFLLKAFGKGEAAPVFFCEGRLADNGDQSPQVTTFGVKGIELVGYLAMIGPGFTGTNSGVHQA